MSIVKRSQVALGYLAAALGTIVSPKKAREIEARYEAGRRYDPRRSYVPGYYQDARLDASQMDRIEIVRKARYFEQNNAIVNRLADLFEQYTVGPNGLKFVPASSDREWNNAARENWNTWCTMPDISSLWNFSTIQSLASRSWLVDGELFVIKTSGRVRADQQSFPRIQLVETHRIETPPGSFGDTSIHDGVQLDPRGRPIAYFVREGFGVDERHVSYPASSVVHIGEPSRPGMYRSLPMLYPVLNDLHDLDDLQMLEMDAAKEAAETTSTISTKSGELSDEDLRRQRFKIAGSQGTSGGSDQVRTQYYSDVFRGRVKVLKHGDTYEQHVSGRPSVAQQQYWDYLVSKVCAGVGISKLLVLPISMQGTVVRADLDVASSWFRARSSVLASKWTDIYHYVTEWGTRNNSLMADPPADWRRVTVRPPRTVNVDVGRNAQALIAEYLAGWRTLEEICGELGTDWEEVLMQRGTEMARASEIETELKLPPGVLIQAVIEANKAAQQQQQSQQQIVST